VRQENPSPNGFELLVWEQNHLINVSEANAPIDFPMHWHSEVEIIAPMQSDYRLSVGRRVYDLDERDVAFVTPGEIHAISAARNKPSLVLQFPQALLTTLHDFSRSWSLFSIKPVVRHCDEPELARSTLDAMRDIQALRHSGKPFAEARIYARVLDVFAALGEYIMETARGAGDFAPAGENTRKIAEACAHILENCGQPLTLEDMSARMGYSKFYFSRLFKSCTNTSFLSFVTEARMKKAVRLLADKDSGMTDVAMRSGFGSLSTFNRLFKLHKGCTPSEYRRMFINLHDG
jgi:AraC-like DNA-binding protein